MSNTLPIIDLNPLFSGETLGLQKVASEFFHIYSTVGFGLIINHGIPDKLIKNIFEVSQQFHALSFEEKMQIKYGKHLRGYLPPEISTLKFSEFAQGEKPEQCESYIMIDDSPVYQSAKWSHSTLSGVNQWPSQIPAFKTTVMNYFTALKSLGHKLMQVFSVALNLPEHYLDNFFTDPNIFLRLFYYPPIPHRISDDIFGVSPHTDYGCFTILAQDDVGGLQVSTDEKTWLDVPCIPNSFVLNTGQMMSIWSNGLIKSTLHRVINSPQKPRYSVPFFYNCNINSYITPLPGTVTALRPKQVEDIDYGEFTEKSIRLSYDF